DLFEQTGVSNRNVLQRMTQDVDGTTVTHDLRQIEERGAFRFLSSVRQCSENGLTPGRRRRQHASQNARRGVVQFDQRPRRPAQKTTLTHRRAPTESGLDPAGLERPETRSTAIYASLLAWSCDRRECE